MAETTPTTDSIQRCRDVLATATALGMAVEAIPGTTAYEAHISDSADPVDWSLGTFPDRASAQRALAQWAIREMVESGNEPWLRNATSDIDDEGDALLNAWLHDKTPAEVIEYYAELSSDILSVNEATINRALPGTHIPLTAQEIFAFETWGSETCALPCDSSGMSEPHRPWADLGIDMSDLSDDAAALLFEAAKELAYSLDDPQ